ncbi:MAG: NAD(P)H-dependent oxidoreductase [Bdellovibrionota bacterium]
MKPNDDSGKLPTNERPFRVLIIAGSDRRQYNCPGVDSKARMLMLRMAKRLPQDWEIDYEDLGNIFGRATIRSCNACVSTSMALCVWPCNCYEPRSKLEPDLMWNLDLYSRLDLADAWAIIGPINWYGPSSNLKLMFDRLVCMNGGNPREDLIEHKDPELAMQLEHTKVWEELSVNHLEGRTAGFFCYGDYGGDEMDETGRPKVLRHPEYFDPKEEPFENERMSYAPLVWQCRYGGIEVPDHLWTYMLTGANKKYSDDQSEHLAQDDAAMSQFDQWTDAFHHFVAAKGKVQPGKYRAYGYKRPGHLLKDLKLVYRDIKMRLGRARKGSSPELQHSLGLNDDAVLWPYGGEGKRLRKK